jgi:hypothetical protein
VSDYFFLEHQGTPSLAQLVGDMGLPFQNVGDGRFVTAFAGDERPVHVQFQSIGESDIGLVVFLPTPEATERKTLYDRLLTTSFGVGFAKPILLSDSTLALAAEVPLRSLTPAALEGIARSLSRLGNLTATTLSDPIRLEENKQSCAGDQLTYLHVDVGDASGQVPHLFETAGMPCEILTDSSFVCETQARLWETGPTEWLGMKVRLGVNVNERFLFFTVYFSGFKPCGDEEAYLADLLRLNQDHVVAKTCIDSDGDVAARFDVPAPYEGLVEDAWSRLEPLVADVVRVHQRYGTV